MTKFKFGDKVTYRSCKNAFYLTETDEKRSLIAVEKNGVIKGAVVTVFTDEITHASDWVKCSERMPEHGCYLVVSKNKEMNESFIGMEYFTHGAYRKNKFEEITHWMPLPALPQD